jgi:hypothetical protein
MAQATRENSTAADEGPLIDDLAVPVIFYDGQAQPEIRGGTLRTVAYIRRRSKSGGYERCPVAVFVCPADAPAIDGVTISDELRRDCGRAVN